MNDKTLEQVNILKDFLFCSYSNKEFSEQLYEIIEDLENLLINNDNYMKDIMVLDYPFETDTVINQPRFEKQKSID